MFAMGELSGHLSSLRGEISAMREDRIHELAEWREERDKDRDRISNLEKWRMWTLGFAAALTFIMNLAMYFIKWHHS